MRVLLETTCSDSDFNGDCDYAVVELTVALIEQIHARVERARRFGANDADLYEMYFWGGSAEFFDTGLFDACQEALAATANPASAEEVVRCWLADLEHSGHALLPKGVDLEAHTPKRTECDQFILRTRFFGSKPEFELAWTASPKHTDVYVTTRALALVAMDAYLLEGQKTPQETAERT